MLLKYMFVWVPAIVVVVLCMFCELERCISSILVSALYDIKDLFPNLISRTMTA